MCGTGSAFYNSHNNSTALRKKPFVDIVVTFVASIDSRYNCGKEKKKGGYQHFLLLPQSFLNQLYYGHKKIDSVGKELIVLLISQSDNCNITFLLH